MKNHNKIYFKFIQYNLFLVYLIDTERRGIGTLYLTFFFQKNQIVFSFRGCRLKAKSYAPRIIDCSVPFQGYPVISRSRNISFSRTDTVAYFVFSFDSPLIHGDFVERRYGSFWRSNREPRNRTHPYFRCSWFDRRVGPIITLAFANTLHPVPSGRHPVAL